MCDTFCTQIRAFVLTKWRQMHEPPKNNLGCNAWFLKALQPNCRIMLRYVLVFQTGLRRKQQSHNIKCLNERSKRSLSTFLFDWWFAGV